MRISVLGSIEVSVNGRVIQLTGQRQRALLAALALEQGKAVPVAWLVEVVWDASPPPTARAKIHTHISGLRRAIGHDAGELEGPLLTRPPGYTLRSEGVELDLVTFGTLMAEAEKAAKAGGAAVASKLLADALALWRGRAFSDVESPLIQSAAVKLEERRLLAMETKAEVDLVLGCCDCVVAEVSPWLAKNPFRERMRGALMLALYRVGCRADALRLYREGHQQMVTELGLEPGPQLRMLHGHILADDPVLLAHGG